MELPLDMDRILYDCNRNAHLERLLMDRMLFIVKKVAVRTTDTMAAVILAIVLSDVCNDVEVVPRQHILQDENFANRSTSTDDDARLDIKAIDFFHSRLCSIQKNAKVFNL